MHTTPLRVYTQASWTKKLIHIQFNHTVNVERFIGLNVCGFNATEVFTEIPLRCLV